MRQRAQPDLPERDLPERDLPERDLPTVDEAYAAYVGYVRRVLRGCGVAAADAPDLAQEVFVVLLRRVHEHRDPALLRSWLFQTARRVASNHRRSRRRARAREAGGLEIGSLASPDDVVARREAATFIADFLEQLDDEARELFLLSEIEGLGGTEIARLLALKPKTAYSRVYALRRRFDARAADTFGRRRSGGAAAFLPFFASFRRAFAGGGVVKVALAAAALALLLLGWRSLAPAPETAVEPLAPLSDDTAQDARSRTEDSGGVALEVPRGVATLVGTVREADGTAVAGADVCVWRHAVDFAFTAFREPACTRSASDGGFTVTGVSPGGVRVTAAARGFMPGEARVGTAAALSIDAGTERGLEVVLERGGVALSGVVQDMTGGPVEGVLVALQAERSFAGEDMITFGAWGDRPPVVVISGAEGRFTTHVRPGAVRWQAFADGYAATRGEVTAPTSELIVRVAPEAVLAGIVTDAETGRPVSDARVVAWADPRSLSNAAGEVRTDAAGRFRIDRLPPGRYKPWATKPGRLGLAPSSVVLGLGDTAAHVEIAMAEAPSVSAVVTVAGTDEVCPKGVAGLREEGRSRMEWARLQEGRVVFPAVLPGRYRPVVACEGYQFTPFFLPLQVESGAALELNWSVIPGVTVTGTVVRADGSPASAALVSIVQPDGASPMPRGTRADAAGTFSYEGLTPGRYQIRAEAGGAVTPDPHVLDLDEGSSEVRLELADGGGVRGVVLDGEGEPVSGAVVRLETPPRGIGPRVRSGDDGSFEIDALAFGPYTVRAAIGDDGDRGAPVRFELSASSPETDVELVVDASRGEIAGRVVDPAGEAVPDALVSIGAPGTGVTVSASSVLADANGAFRLEHVAAGTHRVIATAPDGASAEARGVRIGAEPLELVVGEAASAAGTIAVDAGALPEVFEVAASVGGQRRVAEVFMLPGGRWVLEGLPAGRVTFAAVTGEGRATASATLKGGEHRDGIELTLAPRVDLQGRVVDVRTGAPLAGYVVVATARDDGYEELGKAAEIAMGIGPGDPRQRTGDDGRFLVPGVPVGLLNVAAFPVGFPESEHDRIVTAVEVAGEQMLELVAAPQRVPRGDAAGDTGLELEPGDHEQPWTIGAISPDGPAHGTALEPGDTIAAVDGHDVGGTLAYLVPQLLRLPAGTRVEVTVARGETVQLTVR